MVGAARNLWLPTRSTAPVWQALVRPIAGEPPRGALSAVAPRRLPTPGGPPARSAERTYRRVVREFMRDAGCTEETAKLWLANAGIAEPPKLNGNGA